MGDYFIFLNLPNVSTCVVEGDSFLCSAFADTRIKLAAANESEKHQLERFCNACKGIPQVLIYFSLSLETFSKPPKVARRDGISPL